VIAFVVGLGSQFGHDFAVNRDLPSNDQALGVTTRRDPG
jgi:hypothetical protein